MASVLISFYLAKRTLANEEKHFSQGSGARMGEGVNKSEQRQGGHTEVTDEAGESLHMKSSKSHYSFQSLSAQGKLASPIRSVYMHASLVFVSVFQPNMQQGE